MSDTLLERAAPALPPHRQTSPSNGKGTAAAAAAATASTPSSTKKPKKGSSSKRGLRPVEAAA